jgi:predicted secreted protein
LGRKQAEEEMQLENRKLREVIESLRAEMGAKSKRLIELQFEMEEIQKARKRQAAEMEENQSRMVRERES